MVHPLSHLGVYNVPGRLSAPLPCQTCVALLLGPEHLGWHSMEYSDMHVFIGAPLDFVRGCDSILSSMNH